VCKWDSRNRKEPLHQNQWPEQESLIPGQQYVVHTPLMNPKKVIYLLHIKPKLIKEFIMGMDQISVGFMYLKNKFPRISDSKIKEGVFGGPQIRELYRVSSLKIIYVKWKKQHRNLQKCHYQL
jgi:hypothetical protein